MKTIVILMLSVAAVSASAEFDREKFMIGSSLLPTNLVTDAIVADMKAAGLDFFHGTDRLTPEGYAVFARHGVPCYGHPVTRWSGRGWGERFERDLFWRMDRSADRFAERFGDCPGMFAVDLGDEPHGCYFPFLRKFALRAKERFPDKFIYLNLFPNYAALATTPESEQGSQLGAPTYAEYIARYCRNMPLDYICYDFYVYSSGCTNNPAMLRKDYWNKIDVADACARTGRSFWYYPQVNSYYSYYPAKPTSEAMMRWQTLSAMAFGAEAINWACWSDHGWWTNNVLSVTGVKSAQYEKVKRVNAQLHRLGEPFMRFRRTSTHFVAHDGAAADRIAGLGVKSVDRLDTGFFRGVRASDGSPLIVGEMASRSGVTDERALFVFSADDPWDLGGRTKDIEFFAAGDVSAYGLDGQVRAVRGADGTYRLPIGSNEALLLVTSGTKSRMDRAKLQIGVYCLAPYARTEHHVKDVKDCNVDFIYGIPADDRATLDFCAKHGLGVIATGAVPFWHGMGGKRTGKMRALKPLADYGKTLAEYRDHPAIWMLDYVDEPSALDMGYIGEVAEYMRAHIPAGITPYINLYPNYASTVLNAKSAVDSQLGTATYAEHVATYVRSVPLDYISWDFYPYTARGTNRPKFLLKDFDNFRIVADACRDAGRSLWFIPQVNSYHADEWMTVNKLRFQANLALAFGAETINWACWSRVNAAETPDMPGLHGWWTNNVLTLTGERTRQYDRLKQVNAELHTIGEDYMRFRRTATHFIDFSPKAGLDGIGVPVIESLDTGWFMGVHAEDRLPLVVGEMAPRDRIDGSRAMFVFAADDPWDEHPVRRRVLFRASGEVRAFGGNGPVVLSRAEDGDYSFRFGSNEAVLVTVK